MVVSVESMDGSCVVRVMKLAPSRVWIGTHLIDFVYLSCSFYPPVDGSLSSASSHSSETGQTISFAIHPNSTPATSGTPSHQGHGKDFGGLDFKIIVDSKTGSAITIHLVAPTLQEKTAWISDISQVSQRRLTFRGVRLHFRNRSQFMPGSKPCLYFLMSFRIMIDCPAVVCLELQRFFPFTWVASNFDRWARHWDSPDHRLKTSKNTENQISINYRNITKLDSKFLKFH